MSITVKKFEINKTQIKKMEFDWLQGSALKNLEDSLLRLKHTEVDFLQGEKNSYPPKEYITYSHCTGLEIDYEKQAISVYVTLDSSELNQEAGWADLYFVIKVNVSRFKRSLQASNSAYMMRLKKSQVYKEPYLIGKCKERGR